MPPDAEEPVDREGEGSTTTRDCRPDDLAETVPVRVVELLSQLNDMPDEVIRAAKELYERLPDAGSRGRSKKRPGLRSEPVASAR